MSSFSQFKDNLLLYGLEFFNLYYGNYKGIVVECVDPEKRGRLKVKVPEVWGDKAKNIWVLPKGMYASSNAGMHFMPKKNDTVWIEFEHGDPDYPIWNFGWWLKDKAIELAGEDKYLICTPKGHVLLFDEKDDTIFIKFKDGKAIQLDKDYINLGTETGAKEKAALGETLKAKVEKFHDIVDDLNTAIMALQVPTAFGPSGTPINAADFVQVQTKLAQLKTEYEEFLSDVVKLD
ncbi:MAG: hypothetical protein EKK63_12670 [Acinetobacter sp.]|uniref:phage baseplate assembly protein V n=1 Tax=Acinetobacter sp. TaxID=472 RepID=UPI000FB490D2|nr:phage baseplate assembly protein V [Acinetobacter sp.]RUP38227.1 MAG: hypothetical protein EKK63_12670 [Acinetobacter sp.]